MNTAPHAPAPTEAPTSAAYFDSLEGRLAIMAQQVRDLQAELARVRALARPHMPWSHWLRHQIKANLGLQVHLGKLAFPHPPCVLRVPKWYHKKPALANPPVISVVTPSFNQGSYLEKTIESVLSQEYPRLEYVIQDGGSTDTTAEVIAKFRGRLHHWESRKDNGQSHAINLGLSRTTGEVMAYLNSDDLLLPGSLHAVARYFSDHPEVDVVYGHRVVIDGDGDELGRWVLPPHCDAALKWADYVPQETMFWRRRIWEKVGGHIDESFRFAMDWDLLLRFQAAGAKFHRLGRFLGAFRVHDESKTMTVVNSHGAEEMAKLRRRSHGRDVTPLEINAGIRAYHAWHVFYNRLYRMGLFRY